MWLGLRLYSAWPNQQSCRHIHNLMFFAPLLCVWAFLNRANTQFLFSEVRRFGFIFFLVLASGSCFRCTFSVAVAAAPGIMKRGHWRLFVFSKCDIQRSGVMFPAQPAPASRPPRCGTNETASLTGSTANYSH